MIGLSSLLRSDATPDSDTIRSYIDDISSSGQRLLGLIDTMLDFAKAESGKLNMSFELVDIRALIAGVIDLNSSAGGAKNIDLQVDIQPDICDVVTDGTRLTQVVSELLSNAIKFSVRGGRVRIGACRNGATAFRIDVEDHGIGIEEKDLPRLFTAFRQLSEGSTKKYPGAGLGLALARRIVEALGGAVHVVSSKGLGSVFSVTLPIGQVSPVAGAVDFSV